MQEIKEKKKKKAAEQQSDQERHEKPGRRVTFPSDLDHLSIVPIDDHHNEKITGSFLASAAAFYLFGEKKKKKKPAFVTLKGSSDKGKGVAKILYGNLAK